MAIRPQSFFTVQIHLTSEKISYKGHSGDGVVLGAQGDGVVFGAQGDGVVFVRY
jgi:hypothetical protein